MTTTSRQYGNQRGSCAFWRSFLVNTAYEHGTVADAVVLAEVQTHPQHWRIFRAASMEAR